MVNGDDKNAVEISVDNLRVKISKDFVGKVKEAAEEVGNAAEKVRPHFEKLGAVRDLIDLIRGKR